MAVDPQMVIQATSAVDQSLDDANAGGMQAYQGKQQTRTGALLGGYGLYQMYKGAEAERQAEIQKGAAEAQIKGTRYADYNQAYYNELQRRQSIGLPQEQQAYMEQMADRSAGVALGAMDDRRAGLMGIGTAQQNLANAYRNIGLADVAAREANAQAVLGEMGNRGFSSYNEQLRNSGIDLANAVQQRQEAVSQQQAGTQNTFNGMNTFQQGRYNQRSGLNQATTAMSPISMAGNFAGAGGQPPTGMGTGQPMYGQPTTPQTFQPNYNQSLSNPSASPYYQSGGFGSYGG